MAKRKLTSKQRADNIERARKWRLANAEQNRANIRKWHLEHRDQERERKRQLYLANQEKVKARTRAWERANPERAAELNRKWKLANAEKERIRKDKWKKANPEKEAAQGRKWRLEHPEEYRALRRNADARRRSAPGRHSAGDVRALLDKQRAKCAGCRTVLIEDGKQIFHVDHVQPIARGGTNNPENLQLLCPPCNRKKRDMDPYEWAQSKGRLFA